MLHRSAVGAFAACMAIASFASAGSFTTDGTWTFDPNAVFTESFEQFTPDPDAGSSAHLEAAEDSGALHGSKVLHARATYESADIGFVVPGPGAWRASAWVRSDAIAGVVVEASAGTPGEFSQMFPTGRMTSDGWIELESAPFMASGETDTKLYVFFFGDDVYADAIEVTAAQGVAWEPPRACAGLMDPSCSGDHLCYAGWCRNVSGWVPPLPDASRRDLLVDYLANRLRFFFGPYESRNAHLPAALAELEGMRSAASRWIFWRSFATAVHRLQDSHTSVYTLADFVVENRRPLNACFVLGDADLSHASVPPDAVLPDILVSHTGNEAAWGFNAGDRLVAVDGKHPIAWMRSLIAHDLTAPSVNDDTSLAMFAERLRSAIPRYAHTISVLHCSTSACSEVENIDVTSLPEVEQDTSIDVVACDHRPGALLGSQPSNHDIGMQALSGNVLGTDSSEKIYGLVWDDLLAQSPSATQIANAVASWRADARGVILDHRTGNGGQGEPGTTASGDPIVNFVRQPTFFGVELWRRAADEEGPASLAEGLDIVDKYKGTSAAWHGGSDDARIDVPVALLITRDVSFSDLFAYAMKGAPHVRIFGPNPTHGAFSTFLGMGYATGMNYQIAIGDAIGFDGQTLCGHGVRPDEVVLPRQSDLIAGRDTTILRAIEWVRSEATP